MEIDMLNLGNADSILVTKWTGGQAVRVLVDGGNKGDAESVITFLKGLGITYLDHIVCSHPHDDHAGGLEGIIKTIAFGRFWMHVPSRHIDMSQLRLALILESAQAKKNIVRILNESLQTTANLEAVVNKLGKTVEEPFADQVIGPLVVCGPTQAFYEQRLAEFKDLDKLRAFEMLMEHRQQQVSNEDRGLVAESSALGVGGTEPENNSSTILGLKFGDDTVLLTSDAGVEALDAAKSVYALANLRWMQIPHHGSRRNISEELIAHFNPKTAYVSAIGSVKHPRKAVVNAFKRQGAKVFSTHPAPGGHKRFRLGTVPERANYSSTSALWD
ncbi:MAG: MBL fold metallo-hydrolase [Flavobacteriales bacterium]|nr:MBL fold metallo-hydrolase [Flavobacteriales bacterium]